MMIGWMHKKREATVILLQFVAVCSLLSMVCATTPELPAGETIGQWVWFGKAVLVSTGCITASCLLQLLGKTSWTDILCFRNFFVHVAWSLVLLGAIEAVWGLRQLYGFSVSGHSRYALTGSFFNPGPYGGYLAMILPVCLHLYLRACEWKSTDVLHKIEKVTAGLAGILILCVLPATMSRSAWIAAAISCAWVAYMHRDRRKWSVLWRRYKKRYLTWVVVGLFVLILGGAGIFFLKPDSAMGRLFMWKITCKAIVEHPWGCREGFVYAYGEAQEKYFGSGDYAVWEERVAGSPEYAFNEYLELALTAGVMLGVMFFSTIGAGLWLGTKWGRYEICGALISLLVFSFSSYPMHFPVFMVTGICLLFACGAGDVGGKFLICGTCALIWTVGLNGKWQREEDACRDWVYARMLYHQGNYTAANEAYHKLYPQLDERGEFLFEYGHSLYKSGRYDLSNSFLEQAALYSTDPMILNIIGKNYQEMQYYEKAETYYWASVHRLPGRIYPYYLLAKLYAEPGYRNREKFEKMQRIVLTKEPKVYSTAIREMRSEVEKIGDDWCKTKIDR